MSKSTFFKQGHPRKNDISPEFFGHFFRRFNAHLSVEETVEKGREEALKRHEEGGEEAPEGKVPQALVVRRGHHLKAVGDAQQRLQNDGGLHGLPG